jgi:C4-dicarboxylate-specific signal transduction histidine kinase
VPRAHVDVVLADMRRLLQRLAGPHVDLVIEAEQGLPAVRFNAAVLRQMLVELVRASGEAMPDGGRIAVRASAGETNVELSVTPGAETELATVVGLAVPNGADVHVEPSDDGSGSKLSIYLPVWA